MTAEEKWEKAKIEANPLMKNLIDRTIAAPYWNEGADFGRAYARKEAEVLVGALQYIANTDLTWEEPDILWLADWRNERKRLAKEALAAWKESR